MPSRNPKPKINAKMKAAQFKKGQSGNPQGARLHNPATKALAKLTVDTYREVIELVLTGNVAAIQQMIQSPDTPAIQVGVATAFLKAIKNGDYAVIERIAERIVGKIPDEVNINSKNVNANLTATVDRALLKAAYDDLEKDV